MRPAFLIFIMLVNRDNFTTMFKGLSLFIEDFFHLLTPVVPEPLPHSSQLKYNTRLMTDKASPSSGRNRFLSFTAVISPSMKSFSRNLRIFTQARNKFLFFQKLLDFKGVSDRKRLREEWEEPLSAQVLKRDRLIVFSGKKMRCDVPSQTRGAGYSRGDGKRQKGKRSIRGQ